MQLFDRFGVVSYGSNMLIVYHLDVHFNRLVDPAVRATGSHVLMRSPESLCGNHCEHAWFEFNHIHGKLLFSSGAPSEIDQLSELPTPVCRRHTLKIAVVPTVVQCGGCCSSILVPFYAPILLVNSSLILCFIAGPNPNIQIISNHIIMKRRPIWYSGFSRFKVSKLTRNEWVQNRLLQI